MKAARLTQLWTVSRRWGPILGYGACQALGALTLQWLDYGRLARARWADISLFIVAAGFLALGLFAGLRLARPQTAPPHDGNPQAQAALGISARELTVLKALAAGRSNKEIALELHVSPNTVKTHVARLYEKLGAKRRTDAVARARELALIP